MKRTLTTLTLCCAGLTATLVSQDLLACGGTFCDSGPAATPVDQTGENVLFVLDGATVEAHVQIQYVGGATRFAWIVPMPKIPQVSVGSQNLFNALMQGTVPTYGVSRTSDQCGNGFAGSSNVGSGGPILLPGTGGTSGSVDGGPTVVFDKIVGSFEVAVLQGGTAREVSDWLASNGYQTTANAETLLAPYVQKSFVFAAIKLTADADVTEIHPLVFRYAGNEPCVPLQLTAVAAQPDMGVRTFFLGDDRVFPSNYAHVVLNPVRVDWSTNASNYKTAVSRAVDSPGSDGHGFVTEYAGSTSSVVNPAGLYDPAWNAAAFRTASPGNVVNLLNSQGLTSCYAAYQCAFPQPLVLPLLLQYLPVSPTGTPADYACLTCDPEAGTCTGCNNTPIDASKWDGNAFADDLQTRVIDPALHAQALLQRWTYLTRLYTTISPEEMTLDPTFKAMPEHDYETVSNTGAFGNLRTTCCGKQVLDIPKQGDVPGREVALDAGRWPPFSSLMPWAERIEQAPLLGDLMTVADNSQAVDAELARWNEAQGWPAGSGQGGFTCSGGSGGVGFSGGFSTGGDQGLQPGGGSSCNCSVPGRHNALGLAAVLGLVGFGLVRRRRS